MRRTRTRRLTHAVALGAVACTVALPVPVAAMGWGDGCDPGRGDDFETHRWDGYFMHDGSWTQNPVYVAEAQILEYSPFVNDSPRGTKGGMASAWVMLSNEELSNKCRGWCAYAQDGWIEFPGTSRHQYYEYTDDMGGHWNQLYPNQNNGAVVNNYTTYRTEYNPNDKLFRFYMSDYNNGQQVVGQVSSTTLGWTPDIAFISGETASYATQMPGGSSFNENFYWPEIGTPANMNYHLSDNIDSTNDDTYAYGQYPGSGSSNLGGINYFSIWDVACGH